MTAIGRDCYRGAFHSGHADDDAGLFCSSGRVDIGGIVAFLRSVRVLRMRDIRAHSVLIELVQLLPSKKQFPADEKDRTIIQTPF